MTLALLVDLASRSPPAEPFSPIELDLMRNLVGNTMPVDRYRIMATNALTLSRLLGRMLATIDEIRQIA